MLDNLTLTAHVSCIQQHRQPTNLQTELLLMYVMILLADRTAARYWHHTVMCASVCLLCCALWWNDTFCRKSVWTSQQYV